MKRKKYVILGGNGVFGVHAAFYLLANANPSKVICVGRNPEKLAPFTLDLGRGDARYSYHQIHLVFEQDRLLELLDEERPEVIINFAAQGEGAASWKASWRFFETNAVALARITEELMKRDYLERWIQISTSELYGSAVDRPAREDDPIRCSSPYSASKAAADMHLLAIWQVLGFPAVILRPSNAYAPGQLLHRVIPRAVVAGLTGKKMPLNGGGVVSKSYIHARDLGKAIHMAAEHAPPGRVYNVGPDDTITIRNLVARIAKILDLDLHDICEISPARTGEDQVYWLDSSAIHAELGWRPEVDLDIGLAEMVQWGRTYIDTLSGWPTNYILRA